MPSQYKRQNSHNQKTSENRISRCHKTYLRQKNHVSTYRDHAADNRHISPVYCSIRQFIPQRQRIINTLKQISHQHPRQYRQPAKILRPQEIFQYIEKIHDTQKDH